MMKHAGIDVVLSISGHTAGGVTARRMCPLTSLMEFGAGNVLGTKREGDVRWDL